MGFGMGRGVFRLLVATCALVAVPSVANAHALFVKPVPRDTTDQKLKFGPCGGTAANALLPKGQPVEQYAPGSTITVDFKETIGHQGCYLFQLSTTGDDKNFTTLKQVMDPAGNQGNQQTTLALPAGTTCMNCTLRVIQVMLGATCAANQDPTNTSNYYSCADVRIGNFTDAGSLMDAGMPDYDAASQDEPGSSSSGGTSTTPTDGGGNVKDPEDDEANGATSSRNLQAGKGDDCSVGFGTTTGVSAFMSAGIAAMALLRRRRNKR